MSELEIIKKLYSDSQRPTMLLDDSGNYLWCNVSGMAVNLISLAGFISKHIGKNERFSIETVLVSGECELRYCKNIGSGVYVAEVFEKTRIDISHNDTGYLNLIIRNGVSMITSTFQLLYDELGATLSDESVMYLNNGMLGCYDMLRGAAMYNDSNRTIAQASENVIVDFSCLMDDLYNELDDFSQKLPIKFELQIDSGIFVNCDYDLLYSLVSWYVLKFCRKYVVSDFILNLKKDSENAFFSIEVKDNDIIFDDGVLRRSDTMVSTDLYLKKCIDNLLAGVGGKKCGENGFLIPMCEITSIPLKSPSVRYKADRFAKTRVFLSDIYKIDYFDDDSKE